MIKKTLLVVVMLLVTTSVWAAKTWDVSATTHNLGSTATATYGIYVASNEDEVCIFCHTPHGGTLNTPLWNRTLPNQAGAAAFSHYTSTTLSQPLKALSTTRPISAESLLCMSCHDGVIGVGTLVNYSNRTVGNPSNEGAYIPYMFGAPGSAIGDSWTNDLPTRDLRDDHPISFSYFDVKADVAKGGRLHTSLDARNAGIRFFGADAAGGLKVECSSCHDPHVNGNIDSAYAPFLVMPNTGSALCLACHIK